MWLIKKICIALFSFLLLVYLLFKFTAIPDPFPKESASAYWETEGPYKPLKIDVSLRDLTRPTQANTRLSDFEGLPYRELNSVIWYPGQLTPTSHPLIVYSHGLSSEKSDGEYLSHLLASHGYIVIAADYPLTSRHAPGGALISDVVNQPGDISFLLDNIMAKGNPLGDKFSAYVDQSRIAAMGISLGGLTTSLVSYHPRLRDKRIQAAVSIAGVSAMLGKDFYQNSAIPFMMIGATIDAVLPFEYHASVIPHRVNNSVLVSIENASHMGFADIARSVRWMRNADVIACMFINSMRNVAKVNPEMEKAWYRELGTRDQGVVVDESSEACPEDFEYPKAINPIKQQMLTKVAVLSFFESHFSNTKQRKQEAQTFLLEHFAQENSHIKISTSKKHQRLRK